MLAATFDYTRATTVTDALDALGSRPHARVLAGGQSLLNVLKHRAATADLLVDITGLSELRFIDVGPERIVVGPATTYADIAADPALRAAFPRVADMVAHTVDVQVRNRGTIGGNTCYADPCSNFPPLLVALGATLHVASSAQEREVPADEFFLGAFRTALRAGEMLTAISIPTIGADAGVGYHSIQLMPDIWALARAAVAVRANGTVEAACVVLGAVEPAPRRQPAVEELLVGGEPTPERIAQAAAAVDELPAAIADVHGSADYRRKLARVVVRRAIHEALALRGNP